MGGCRAAARTMSNLDALVEISKVARTVAGNVLYRRLIANLTIAVLLTVITGMLAGALLIIGSYAAYLALIRHGLDADAAMLAISGVIALATAASAALAIHYVHRLRRAMLPVPPIAQISEIASAFVDGFTESSHKQKDP